MSVLDLTICRALKGTVTDAEHHLWKEMMSNEKGSCWSEFVLIFMLFDWKWINNDPQRLTLEHVPFSTERMQAFVILNHIFVIQLYNLIMVRKSGGGSALILCWSDPRTAYKKGRIMVIRPSKTSQSWKNLMWRRSSSINLWSHYYSHFPCLSQSLFAVR